MPAVGNSNGPASAIRSARRSTESDSECRSTQTLEPCTSPIPQKLMRLSGALLARLFRLPGRNSALATPGTYTRHLSQPCAFLNPDGCSWSKSQASFQIEGLSENTLEAWSRSGIAFSGRAFPLAALVRLTGETGSGSSPDLWPTPQVAGGGNNCELTPKGKHYLRPSGKKAHLALDQATKLWATPKVSTGDYCYSQGDHENPVLNLSGQVKLWSTPKTTENRGTNSRQRDINLEARLWSTPKASTRGDCPSERNRRSPDMVTEATLWTTGEMLKRSKERTAASGSLSPDFHCWLMGFPKGWNELDPQEMLLLRQSRISSGKRSTKSKKNLSAAGGKSVNRTPVKRRK